MPERKPYLLTERAGEWVAGYRRPADGVLLLTDGQAAHELRLGTIRPKPAEPAPVPPPASAPVVAEPEAPKPRRRRRAREPKV
jgi:hypothetical protein